LAVGAIGGHAPEAGRKGVQEASNFQLEINWTLWRLSTDEVAHLQPRLRLGSYPISCGRMIVEGVDALKGAIRPLSLDCPLIAVTEDNVKDRLLRALGHSYAIPHKNDSLETIQKLLNPRMLTMASIGVL
jgi:hypothetical protein